jgi:hypothetical protein
LKPNKLIYQELLGGARPFKGINDKTGLGKDFPGKNKYEVNKGGWMLSVVSSWFKKRICWSFV